jgi:uncharacterized protein YecE (DUF72 family)
MAQVFIGTSGWTYPNWKGTFYSEDLPSARFLEFYAKRFPTTEVNYSFYHLPKPATYEKWSTQVPDGFIFAVKASRLMTHTKRLRDVDELWRLFLQNAQSLASRLGPILFQFPASFRCDHARLAGFLKMARKVAPGIDRLRLVFEFRHESWFVDEVYRLLSCHGAALCIADSPKYPRREIATGNFVYFRFHGRTQLFTSSYTRAELADEAKKMRRMLEEGHDVYAYFNNDAAGYAIANARTLTEMMRTSQRLKGTSYLSSSGALSSSTPRCM